MSRSLGRARVRGRRHADLWCSTTGWGTCARSRRRSSTSARAATIGADPDEVRAADGLILPGVGAFPRAMERIRATGLDELIAERAAAGTPILGICLGLQLLFERSEELGGAEGLGLLAGRGDGARRARAEGAEHRLGAGPLGARVAPRRPGSPPRRPSTSSTPSSPGRPPRTSLGTAEYGERFACAVERDNVFGVQFHPEKSSAAGLRLLANFAGICAKAPAAA